MKSLQCSESSVNGGSGKKSRDSGFVSEPFLLAIEKMMSMDVWLTCVKRLGAHYDYN